MSKDKQDGNPLWATGPAKVGRIVSQLRQPSTILTQLIMVTAEDNS
jgi:hypothetical protein